MRFQTTASFLVIGALSVVIGSPAFALGQGHGGSASRGGGAVRSAAGPAAGVRGGAGMNGGRSMSQGAVAQGQRGGIGGQSRFGGRGRGGFGAGAIAAGAAAGALGGYGYGDGGYGQDYAGYGGDYGYDGGYDQGVQQSYAQPYGLTVQPGYGQYAVDGGDVQTGRSVAQGGNTCSTPIKACALYHPAYVGAACSCRVPGGHAEGRVTP